jgi:hypothetical protein
MRPSAPEAVQAVLAQANATSAPLPRRPWFSDLPDRGLFILFLTAGTALVLALKLTVPEARVAGWSAAIAACAALFGYAALAWRLRMPGDRLGDNCYYLGFLLTLASIAAALIQFDVAASDRGPVLERLIGSFGIALFSTFLGIALRAVFLQVHREIDDLEDLARQDLQARADQLKGQLLAAVTELESFRLRTRQVLDERVMQVTDILAQHARAQSEQVLGLARDLADQGSRALAVHTEQAMRLEAAIRVQTEAAAALAERIGRIEVPPDLLQQKLQALADRLAASVAPLEQAAAALAERIGRIEVPPDLLQQKLQALADRLAASVAPLEQAAAALAERVRAIDVPTDLVAARLQPLVGALAEATRAIEEATASLGSRRRGLFGWFSRAQDRHRTRS